ncbi:hypothetical protein [Aliarcobacter thereius]|uniref:Uncharacterized protein n=2 Tax=Aliarcobacter thereius TaxID=544718 RepID=A0A1C0B5N0_9BACT|nr:hypothetical protein [Aliarcobacter thereius]OCL90488.1 hypothetical protein AAX25_01581 [Aliarcobacter thereius]OCL95717.1 hypothetical protein AA347_01197 [Aliarcobacter thereius LMG 24486]OCL98361.1 hypothetical protein AAX29_01598 [Aliarcobacter thereius]
MKFGKYMFESYEEFQNILKLALENGIGTMKEFGEFLRLNCSQFMVKN